MRSSHHSGAMAALVLLILLAVLFWNKLAAMFTQGTSSATLAGVPVPASATGALAAATSNPYPDNVPAIVPYNPGPVPVGAGDLSAQDVLPFGDFGPTQTQLGSDVSAVGTLEYPINPAIPPAAPSANSTQRSPYRTFVV